MNDILRNRSQSRPISILLVEDELSNLNFMRAILRSNGHRVLEAQDAATALEIMQEDYIELLVTNVHLPRMGGIALVKEARELFSELKAVVISGGLGAAERQAVDELQVMAHLEKPFSASDLIDCVHAALGAKLPCAV